MAAWRTGERQQGTLSLSVLITIFPGEPGLAGFVVRCDAYALRLLAMATWLDGWVGGWVSVTAGIVSKRLNL